MSPSRRGLLAASLAMAGTGSGLALAKPAVPVTSKRTPAACATHIVLARIPRDIAIFRAGARVRPPKRLKGAKSAPPPKPFLEAGDEVFVSRPGFRLSYAGNRFGVAHAEFRL